MCPVRPSRLCCAVACLTAVAALLFAGNAAACHVCRQPACHAERLVDCQFHQQQFAYTLYPFPAKYPAPLQLIQPYNPPSQVVWGAGQGALTTFPAPAPYQLQQPLYGWSAPQLHAYAQQKYGQHAAQASTMHAQASPSVSPFTTEAAKAPPSPLVIKAREIMLQAGCVQCHNPRDRKGGFALYRDSQNWEPANWANLYEAVASQRMPPGPQKLQPDAVEVFRQLAAGSPTTQTPSEPTQPTAPAGQPTAQPAAATPAVTLDGLADTIKDAVAAGFAAAVPQVLDKLLPREPVPVQPAEPEKPAAQPQPATDDFEFNNGG